MMPNLKNENLRQERGLSTQPLFRTERLFIGNETMSATSGIGRGPYDQKSLAPG